MANMEPENFLFVVCDSENPNVGYFMRVYTTIEMAEKARTKYQLISSKKLLIRRVPVDYI